MSYRVIYAANITSPAPFETREQARGYLWHRFGMTLTSFVTLADGSDLFYFDPGLEGCSVESERVADVEIIARIVSDG